MTTLTYEFKIQGSFCSCTGTPPLRSSNQVEATLVNGVTKFSIVHVLTCARCQVSVRIPSTSVTANVSLGAP